MMDAGTAATDRVAYSRQAPVVGAYDVVVCGGGLTGCAAALSAARAGVRVLLVEATGQLGGVATSGGVYSILGGRTPDNRHQCVTGIFAELSAELIRRGAAVDPDSIPQEKYPPYGWFPGLATGLVFAPVQLAALLEEKLATEAVDLSLGTSFVDAVLDDGPAIRHLILHSKSGLEAVEARCVVDATGDADVAARSGCQVVCGREEDGLMAPASLEFTVDGVDQEALRAYIYTHNSPRFRELIQELRAAGEWPFPYDIFIAFQCMEPGTFFINTTRLCGVDGTDRQSVSEALQRGRQEVLQLLGIMRSHFPGFSRARLCSVAPSLGVRETRRIVGDFVLTVQDLVEGREFEDTIGFSGYGWDLPDPQRPSVQPMHDRAVTRRRPYTPIPYRCMLPRPVTNLICPGRAVSVERDVLGPLRVMAPCMAMGEAAGLAAAQVVESGVDFGEVDVAALRDRLRADGARVDWD